MPPTRLTILIVLLLLTTATPALCQGFVASVPEAVDPGGGALLSPDMGRLPVPGVAVLNAPTLGSGWTWRESDGARGVEPRGLARLTQRLGDPRIVGPALLAGYVTGRITGLPDFSAACARVAGVTLGAALLQGGLELAAVRGRPGDPGASRPAGRLDAALPTSHATVAFAAASAIAAEAPARWVPWVVYPAAALAGLAQAEQDHLGLGGVAAGAALGIWTGRKVDQFERGQVRLFDRARFLVRGSPRNFRLGFKARF